jgi:hypothetical protein
MMEPCVTAYQSYSGTDMVTVLSPLQPSSTVIHVANIAVINSLQIWEGTITVGGVEACSRFKVFDCSKAFDVILRKPWLKQYVHYMTTKPTLSQSQITTPPPPLRIPSSHYCPKHNSNKPRSPSCSTSHYR